MGFQRRQRRLVLAGEGLAAHAGGHRPRIVEIDAHPGVGAFGGIDAHHHVEGGLAGGVGAPVGHDAARDPRGHENGAAGVGGAQQRIERADQPPVGGDVHRHHLLEEFRLDVADRRERAQHAGVAQQHVEPAEAFMQRRTQPVDAGPVGDVERHQGGGAAERLDLVVEGLEPAYGPRHQHAMSAFAGVGQRRGGAQAARGAGDQGNAAGETAGGGPAVGSTGHDGVRRLRPGRRAGDPRCQSGRRVRSGSRR